MLWEALVVVPIWAVYELLSIYFYDIWHPTLLVAASVPIGFITSTWLHFFGQLIMPLGETLSFIVVIWYLHVAIACRLMHGKRNWKKMPETFYLVMCFALLIFFFACHCTFLQDGISSQGTAYSDLPFHMNLATSFAFGVNANRTSFWPFKTTFFAWEKLVYPIIPDYNSACLIAAGASARMSMFIPSLMLCLSLMALLYHLARRFSSTRFVPELTILLFCLAGGSGWKSYFNTKIDWNSTTGINTNYAHNLGMKETFWIHPIIHFLFPQRSAMFSMPVCVYVMIALLDSAICRYKRPGLMLLAGIGVALTPMVSGHSFLTICIFAGGVAVMSCPWMIPRKWMKFVGKWIIFCIPILCFGVPQGLVFMKRVSSGHFMRIRSIWNDYRHNTITGWFSLWWESLSVFVMIAVFHAWIVLNKSQRKMYIPAFLVFVVASFVRFQPGAMDNTKVFIAGWYPLACCAVAEFILQLRRSGSILSNILALLLFVGAIPAGTMCIGKSLSMPFPMFSYSTWDSGVWAAENTPTDSVFLTATNPGVAVTCVAGRTSLLTFNGWVWSHGIAMGDRPSLIAKMWEHDAALFRKYGVNYIHNVKDKTYNRVKMGEFETEWISVFRNQEVEIWQVVNDLLRAPESIQ